MASTTTAGLPGPHGTPPGETRRDFLGLVTGAFTGLGSIAVAWALVDSMNPAGDVIAAGAAMDIDISKIEAGQEITVRWRGNPILVVNRTPEALKSLQDPSDIALLSDPNSTVNQQPPYAKNWHRSLKPEYLVLVGICTHLGCLPLYLPQPNPTDPVPNWKGGYFCPCHGSKYDLAGRVYTNVPAPYNLPVPPYHFPDDKTLRVGENPTGVVFELSEVVQM
ncbi:MAG TPA: ubiquinol-cytochrome c reductase iron-sulfur subunit [Acetobacteraceae bacterium]|nr:ubiquinol-cytochrome c reductase iron-sulfur subunit [Acetobacteraceae bacterium]